jgi:hypothetical protein
LNQIEKGQDEVEEDIEINGISRCCTRWIHHGEGDNDVEQDDGTLTVVLKICHGMMEMTRLHLMMKVKLKMS